MVTSLNLQTGSIEGAAWDTGYAAIEDFLDSLFQKYSSLVDKDTGVKSSGQVLVNWEYIGGNLLMKSIEVNYDGDCKCKESFAPALKDWIFCKSMDFAKVVGVISVKQRDI